jgi:hypothetical protein
MRARLFSAAKEALVLEQMFSPGKSVASTSSSDVTLRVVTTDVLPTAGSGRMFFTTRRRCTSLRPESRLM